jgi:DNA-binding IclR family transcriptional regulator
MDKSFLKGLALLELMAKTGKARGVTELAGMLSLTKSNVHRLLQGLVYQGFVRNIDGSGQYELTMKLWELGSYAFAQLDVRLSAQPYMEALAQRTSESVHLSVLDGVEVIYVAKVDGPQPVISYTRVGARAPAQCVATGKAQLAWANSMTVDQVKQALRRYTSKSLLDAERLDVELTGVRAVGYALNQGEWADGVCGVASAIRDDSGRVVAAIGVSGPVERLKPRVLRQLGPELLGIAEQISGLLGYGKR